MNDSGQRKKVLVDAKVQGALLRQLIWHWCLACGVMVLYLLILETFATGMSGTLYERVSSVGSRYALLGIVVVTIFPVFLLDSLKLSHRFAGPMVSFKKHLRKLAEGETVPPLHFRDGDFWQELTGDFNRVAERMGLSATNAPGSKRP